MGGVGGLLPQHGQKPAETGLVSFYVVVVCLCVTSFTCLSFQKRPGRRRRSLLVPVLCRRAVDLDNILRYVDKLVHQPLAVDFGQDAPLVVVPQRPAHRLVVHVRFVLVHAPQLGHGLRVDQLEDALLPVGPLDEPGAVLAVLQQLEQELPQVGGGTLAGLALDAHLQLGLLGFLQLPRRESAQLQHVGQLVRTAGRDALRVVMQAVHQPVGHGVPHVCPRMLARMRVVRMQVMLAHDAEACSVAGGRRQRLYPLRRGRRGEMGRRIAGRRRRVHRVQVVIVVGHWNENRRGKQTR